MADVERERVTALWREAAAALEQPSDRDELRSILNRLYLEGGHGWIERAAERLTIITDRKEAECGRLREQLDALVTVAAQYLDTGRGDLDGRIDAARAALGVEGAQEKPT